MPELPSKARTGKRHPTGGDIGVVRPHRAAETTLAHDYFGEPFAPRKPFIGGHAQTIVGNFLPRRNELPPAEERLFAVEPEVQVLCHCHWQPERITATTLVIVHGLEGSSESQYVIGTGSKAWRAGMNVVRMNMRNCGGTEALGPTLYNSSMSHDVGVIAKTLMAEDGLQKLAFAGFSMGGNLVLKLLGEWGENAPRAGDRGHRHLAGDGPGRLGGCLA